MRVFLYINYSTSIQRPSLRLSFFPFLPSVDRIRGFAHAAGFAAARRCLRFLVFSAGTARSAAAWPPANCACARNFLNSLLTPHSVYPFKYKLFIKILSSSLNATLIADKHCSDVCCDEFPVSRIDRKSKQVKEQ